MYKQHIAYFVFLICILLLNIVIYLLPIACNYNDDFSVIYSVFGVMCHQIDSRTLHIFGGKLPVCIRCQGIYLAGLISTFLYPFLKPRLKKNEIPSIWLLLIPVLMMGTDVLFELFGVYNYISIVKFITGFFLGFVLPFFLISGLRKFFEEIHIYKPQNEHK
ncbi:MAG: DUF2085 domain-containing protein [Ignavibacteria bacterium]